MVRKGTTQLPGISRASLDAVDRIVVLFDQPLLSFPAVEMFSISPDTKLNAIRQDSPRRISLFGGPFDRKQPYRLTLRDGTDIPIMPDGILDRLASPGQMGLTWCRDGARVRFFAPRATQVELFIHQLPGEEPFHQIAMTEEFHTGCWSVETDKIKPGMFYGYRVNSRVSEPGCDSIVFADPYSLAITKQSAFPRPSLTLVLSPETQSLPPLPHRSVAPRDLMIYEAHLRDSTILSDVIPQECRGSYPGIIHPVAGGFLDYVRRLRPNTIEWLPLQDYDYEEPPYDPSGNRNGWNPLATNHWGYMPSCYFAPEARYASRGGRGQREGWIGVDGRQVLELRAMVEGLHQAGFAVILDVVYNHVANYGENPLRQIDPQYSLRFNGDGTRHSFSGCGNDLATERPMIRRMIVESLKHWMNFYGIDGFRFDLAGLIDEGTLQLISSELRAIYPDVHLIAEPWGRKYDKSRFTRLGWACWNDRHRDGIRGFEPVHSGTWLFNRGNPDIHHLLTGDRFEEGGPFHDEAQSVNYLACHDGYTLGDFIRIALRDIDPDETFLDKADVPTSDQTLGLLRLAFLLLLTSRGTIMLHQGDEWGRTKWVSLENINDKRAGKIDHDSYNRDNRTNWIQWDELKESSRAALIEYVSELFRIRSLHHALRVARRENTQILKGNQVRSIGILLRVPGDEILLLANASPTQESLFTLPPGDWIALALGHHADAKGVSGVLRAKIAVPPGSGIMLTNANSKSFKEVAS